MLTRPVDLRTSTAIAPDLFFSKLSMEEAQEVLCWQLEVLAAVSAGANTEVHRSV